MTEASEPTRHFEDLSDQRFRLLVESVKDYGIFMLDPEGRITSWNAGAERINGYSAAEIIGSHFSIFYPPEDILAGKPDRELVEATRDGRMEDEGWRVRKDGTRFWADVVITALRDPGTGTLRGFGKVTRDLTERRMAEERLRHNEEELRLLVESVEEYAIYMLDVEGRVMTWNTGAHRAKGYTAEEIIGQSFARFYTAEDRAAGKPQRLLELARLHGKVRDQGMRARKDGTLFPADVLITAVHDGEGKLRGFSKVTRDLTGVERSRELEAAKAAAEKANEAKDQFLAVLSHELRTPLTPVLAAADFLAEQAARITPEELLEHVGTIRRNARLEAQLIDDLLDLTRISRGKLEMHSEAVDVSAALNDAVKICHEEFAKKELNLVRASDCQSCWVWGDPTRLRQILWNLLNNAVKFTPAGGTVTARLVGENPDSVLIEISDTGIGLEPDQLERIFAPFEQAERTVTRRFGGLGLGLAITRSLVEMHNGRISAASPGMGEGATFRVSLKRIPEPDIRDSGSVPAAQPAEYPLRILLVDDHDDTRNVLLRLLVRKRYQVRTASTVASAVAVLAGEEFDVLLSDIGLPDGTGHDVMREARRRNPALHGIALSGFGMDADVARSTDAGFDLHITKPVDVSTLEGHLQTIASERR